MIQTRLIKKSIEHLRIERLQLYDRMIEEVYDLQKTITERVIRYRTSTKIIDAQIKVLQIENLQNDQKSRISDILMGEQENENTRKNDRTE